MSSARIFDLLERIGTLLGAEQRRCAADADLQPVHIRILDYLSRCNRFSNTPAAIAAYLLTTKGTVSQSLLVLQRKGLVTKTPDARDGRVVHLHLTNRGEQVVQSVEQPQPWRSAWAALPKRPAAALEEGLEQLLRSLQQANRWRTFGPCHSCRHLLVEDSERFRCGLTQEPLEAWETRRICQEHELPTHEPGR